MSVRLEKAWQPLCEEALQRLRGQLGVYELADASGKTVFIGYAGGRSRFGLRGELEAELRKRAGSQLQFRYEVNMSYLSRYEELLMAHRADHGSLPEENARQPRRRLGRLSPH
ncbi:MAG: hypothetical protein V3V67_05830 [Myxococcota bacterium]